MDVSRQSVSKWELNESVPDINKIVRLSELFSVSVDELLKEQYTSYVENVDTKSTIEDIVQMNYINSLIKILYLICDYPHKHYTFKHFEV